MQHGGRAKQNSFELEAVAGPGFVNHRFAGSA
jgi:hypothetical protein